MLPQPVSSVAKAKAAASGNKSGTAYDSRNKEVAMIGAKSGNKYRHQDDDKDPMARPLEDAGGIRAAGVWWHILLVRKT